MMTDKDEKISEVIDVPKESNVTTAKESVNENKIVLDNTIKNEIDLGLKYIMESGLTDEQKKLTLQIYDSVKTSLNGLISDETINETIKITRIIGYTIKELENIKIDNKSPSGSDRKAVAIQLGSILITELLPNNTKIIEFYNVIAEPTLEAMIDVSKVVNTVVIETTRKCCPGILELFKIMRSRK